MPPSAPKASIAAAGPNLGRDIERHIDTAFRRCLRGRFVTRDDRFVRLLTGDGHPFANFSLVADPADVSAVNTAIEPLCSCGQPSAVVFPNANIPSATDALLQSKGFGPHAPMPAMAVNISDLAGTSLPPGYAMKRINKGAEGDAWARAFAEGYELPLPCAQAFGPNASNPDDPTGVPIQYFAVIKDGRQVATTMMMLDDGYAGIYCVSTIPSERRKGLGAHITAEVLRTAAPLGYRVGILQASPAGYPVYRQLGFKDFGAVPLYVRMP